MTVLAPPLDTAGAALDAQIAVVQALVTANKNPLVLYQNVQLLNSLQMQAVNHYMSTYWLAADVILASYSPPAWDKVGARLLTRIAGLQTLVNNAPLPNPLASGWTDPANGYKILLYQTQTECVDYMMALPGGTTAATLLSAMTGSQSRPFDYVFSSVGFTSEALEG